MSEARKQRKLVIPETESISKVRKSYENKRKQKQVQECQMILLKIIFLQHISVTKLYKNVTDQKITELYWQPVVEIYNLEN